MWLDVAWCRYITILYPLYLDCIGASTWCQHIKILHLFIVDITHHDLLYGWRRRRIIRSFCNWIRLVWYLNEFSAWYNFTFLMIDDCNRKIDTTLRWCSSVVCLSRLLCWSLSLLLCFVLDESTLSAIASDLQTLIMAFEPHFFCSSATDCAVCLLIFADFDGLWATLLCCPWRLLQVCGYTQLLQCYYCSFTSVLLYFSLVTRDGQIVLIDALCISY